MTHAMSNDKGQPNTPAWMGWVLRAAGVYNVLWGAWVVLFPAHFWDLVGMEQPNYPFLWQCVGMIVGVYGVGYWVAASDVARHWPIVLVGFLGKVFGPIGFLDAWLRLGVLPLHFGVVNIFNDLIWIVPFALMLWHAAEVATARRERAMMDAAVQGVRGGASTSESAQEAMRGAAVRVPGAAKAMSLEAYSVQQPVLVVFLRHLGCTFCREALQDVGEQRERIERSGARVCLVSMAEEGKTRELASKYGLGDVAIVSDPQQRVYAAFELARGTLGQLFGVRMFLRGFAAGVLRRHGVGMLAGDGFQLPGAFVVSKGEIVRAYRHADAADRPDYCELVVG
jgi:peroxiredoxin